MSLTSCYVKIKMRNDGVILGQLQIFRLETKSIVCQHVPIMLYCTAPSGQASFTNVPICVPEDGCESGPGDGQRIERSARDLRAKWHPCLDHGQP